MIIIETKDKNNLFIEGIFHARDDAEKYISRHPKPENCTLIDIECDFPLYIIERFHESFTYFSDRQELNNFIESFKDLRKDQPILYIILGQYISDKINEDSMGSLNHVHITSKKDWQQNKGLVFDS